MSFNCCTKMLLTSLISLWLTHYTWTPLIIRGWLILLLSVTVFIGYWLWLYSIVTGCIYGRPERSILQEISGWWNIVVTLLTIHHSSKDVSSKNREEIKFPVTKILKKNILHLSCMYASPLFQCSLNTVHYISNHYPLIN